MAKVKVEDVQRAIIDIHEALAEISQVVDLFVRQKKNGKIPDEVEVPDDFSHVCAQTGEKAGYAAGC